MTISNTSIKNSYSGNNSTATFNYTFKIFANSDLQVIIRDATGTETVKTITTHYTVAGAGNNSGGSITFTSGNIPTNTETVVIRRAIPQTQSIDYIANDPFPAESHEEGLDRAMMSIQQVQEELDRSIKLSRTNTITSTEFTVDATNRSNKVLAFDGTGEISIAQELGTFKGNWSSGTSYAVRDLVKDTSTNNIFFVNTAHTSSGSQPLTTNANSSKYDLIVDAASASTSASAAASSATSAASSATTATTKASEASTSAANAATSASTASTQASNASSSASTASTQATNAANSATSAATSATNSANSATSAAASASAAAQASGGGTVKVTTNDTTAEVLNEKLAVSGGLTKTTTNAGSDETLTLGIVAGEVYGFTLIDSDSDGITETLRVTTTNAGADSINGTDYAAFDDVIFAGSGITFSLNASGNLIATI
jgi:hypothetical protein